MTTPTWAHDDDELLAMIKEASGAAAPMGGNPATNGAPGSDMGINDMLLARMRRAAKAAYTWRTIDSDLDRLTMSSDSDLMAAAPVRGSSSQPFRIVEFHGANFDLELEIGDDSLIGQVYPPQPGLIDLLTADGTSVPVSVDDVGCFMFDRPATGPFRLRCAIGTDNISNRNDNTGEGVVVTEWITLT